MQKAAQFERVRADQSVITEITERRPLVKAIMDTEPARPLVARAITDHLVPRLGARAVTYSTEAIVLREGRPTLLVRNDTFELPQLKEWKARLLPTKSKIDRAIRSVGRLEVGYAAAPYVGTAWMIAPGVAVTNRHVAVEFGRKRGREFVIRSNPIGQPFVPRVDFREEYVSGAPFEIRIDRILYIADLDDNAPDLAFVELSRPDGRDLPTPIPLFAGQPTTSQIVLTIGYPAEDPRNDASDQARLFGGVYDVKRIAPGMVIDRLSASMFSHDCTTLGGSSGSVVLDVETGAALGLHFAGDYLEANYAVSARTLATSLDKVRRRGLTVSTLSPKAIRKPETERRVTKDQLADRTGYDPGFLGEGQRPVPLPKLSKALALVAVPVNSRRTSIERYRLDYTHYSVVMHKERGFAIFTSVNIDGASTERIKRSGAEPWALDPRIPAKYQHGNDLYAGNDLDRGHLVRRLDPAWGQEAPRGEQDSFFFTNCTPQHKDFNQQLWLSLEDYLLDNANTRGFKACVFTGPVFGDDDRQYRDAYLPDGYWKVASMVNDATGDLSVTGYVVSQADLITGLEFVYGQMKTYQVSVAHIEGLTGLNFGKLRDHDPLAHEEGTPVRDLEWPDDIRL